MSYDERARRRPARVGARQNPRTGRLLDTAPDTALDSALAWRWPTVWRRRPGDVADEILAIAKDVAADAIVIGIRHRSPVGKLIMGSVAQRVIIDASCPVIAVKPA